MLNQIDRCQNIELFTDITATEEASINAGVGSFIDIFTGGDGNKFAFARTQTRSISRKFSNGSGISISFGYGIGIGLDAPTD
ncbi:hypothetical protein H6G17_01495 [Chroococcidiopsis sp. FACHB-1243]|uniref:hypothetical protein n=1 Tax=Chroococcidiopsis sp. [FACHB-1243] TaxID=2692781 RepID=UPI00178550D5|nr:hypothetical protein [Chroococcidiopsis sp. [FACHB-1243]]MBD2304196.1 hypothetical protein [Chroococcidiopsis sp. [FACHB-1243]]